MMTVNDSYIVTFECEEHKRYADLCQEYGFDMGLSAGLKVGLQFVHPTKGHIVRLDREEDPDTSEVYEPHFFIALRTLQLPHVKGMEDYETPMYPEHYSEAEWAWLQIDEPSNFEFLRRELYIWFRVRPRSMNTMKAIDDIQSTEG